MTSARLLSTFVIAADGSGDSKGGLRITDGVTPTTIVIPNGTYVWEGDETADDLGLAIKTRVVATYPAQDFECSIVGAGHTDATRAEGRVRYTASGGAARVDFILTHAGSTIDPRILGYANATADKLMAGGTMTSDLVHRYGHYPQTDAIESNVTTERDAEIAVTSGRYPDGADWGEYSQIELKFDGRYSPLVRTAAAAISDRATALLLTAGDSNCAIDRFVLDLSGSRSRRWYYYATITIAGTRLGPYIFERGSGLWRDPLVESVITHRIGEVWTTGISGITPGA